MKLKSFPKINTKRLFLRKIEESDWEVILYQRSDKTINEFIERPENRKTKNKSDAFKFIKEINEETENDKSITWGITLKNDSKIVGTICLWNFSDNNKTAEVGYGLDPEFQGKGIMSEALISIVNLGFNKLKLDKIEAFTHKENIASKKLLEKNGFYFNMNRKDQDNDANDIFELKRVNIQ